MAATSPIFGQISRGPDDYTGYGTPAQAPIAGEFTFLSGRRTIFNENGKPNRDWDMLVYFDSAGATLCNIPIFADPDIAVAWTALDMIRYILSPPLNAAFNYIPIVDPSALAGL